MMLKFHNYFPNNDALCFKISTMNIRIHAKNRLSKKVQSVSFLYMDVDRNIWTFGGVFVCCQDKIFTRKVNFHQRRKTFLRLSPATNKKLKWNDKKTAKIVLKKPDCFHKGLCFCWGFFVIILNYIYGKVFFRKSEVQDNFDFEDISLSSESALLDDVCDSDETYIRTLYLKCLAK